MPLTNEQIVAGLRAKAADALSEQAALTAPEVLADFGTAGAIQAAEAAAESAADAALFAKAADLIDRPAGGGWTTEPPISHDDWCRLSRAFIQEMSFDKEQDRRIHEWLKGRIAVARILPPADAPKETR